MYDHIIVGAGSAGAVLAERLSRDAAVLLLEAGPDHDSASTPAAVAGPNFFAACLEPGRMWPALSAVHSSAQEPMPYIRGRGVGGSSAVNAMMMVRGLPDDYDRWADELGATGWGAATFDELFARLETTFPMTRFAPDEWAPVDRALHAAAVAAGYDDCPDYHVDGAVGFGPSFMSIRDGRRVSTNDACLEPARGREKLTIRGDALVDRVLLDGTRAAGVRLADGEELEAPSVLVCAGAVHSPAILLRSGVGPDSGLAVGENLTDHPMLPVGLVLHEAAHLQPHQRVLCTVLRYTSGLAGAGPADMQLLPLGIAGPGPDLAGIGAVAVCAMQVFSRGKLTLRSPDPADDPAMDLRLLSDDRDRVRVRDGLARVRALVEHDALTEIAEVALAGESPLAELGEDDASVDAFMDAAVTNYVHVVGTCRMGADDDPAAVVDTDCAVRGHTGLRVVDASVMPDIPRANTHMTVLALAEGIADRLQDR